MTNSHRRPDPELPVIGWREWVSLPGLGVEWIKAKIDTGARSSALHAFGIEAESVGGAPWVRFSIHPHQHGDAGAINASAPVLDRRAVRSSSGAVQDRFVIETELELRGQTVPMELTLARRDAMGFRMLVGREAIRGCFLVDAGRSYYGGRPPLEIRRLGRRPRS